MTTNETPATWGFIRAEDEETGHITSIAATVMTLDKLVRDAYHNLPGHVRLDFADDYSSCRWVYVYEEVIGHGVKA